MTETVSGVVEAKRKDGKGICVAGQWYSAWSADDLFHVNRGDSVVFTYVQKGAFNNLKGKVQVSGSATTGGGAGPAPKPYSNLGVELGHASKLAMDVATAGFTGNVGSAEFYKFWAEQTETIYKIMKGLRAKYESAPTPQEEAAEAAVDAVPVAVAEVPHIVSTEDPF